LERKEIEERVKWIGLDIPPKDKELQRQIDNGMDLEKRAIVSFLSGDSLCFISA
jgi:hypothetical protein